MKMKNILIGVGGVAILITAFILFNSYKDNQIIKQTILRTESEMRFKQLVKENAIHQHQKDSIASVVAQKQALIDFLENNPQIIIQNNEKNHFDIQRLNAYNSIMLFTRNTAKYDSLKSGRYNIGRFSKHN